jgi:hypothetical protein
VGQKLSHCQQNRQGRQNNTILPNQFPKECRRRVSHNMHELKWWFELSQFRGGRLAARPGMENLLKSRSRVFEHFTG